MNTKFVGRVLVGMGLVLLLTRALGPTGALAAEPGAEVRVIDSFEHGIDPGWETKSFKGQNRYVVEPCETGKCLKATSTASATGLIYRLSYKVQDFPILSWRWKVENVLEKGDARTKEGDDYAARVYVVFPHWFSPRTRVINYIWANKLEKGAAVPNPFFNNAVMIAVQSGKDNLGQWIAERRNVFNDYREIFGDDPPPAGAVAIMTDTDNTGETAQAWYDDIRLEKTTE